MEELTKVAAVAVELAKAVALAADGCPRILLMVAVSAIVTDARVLPEGHMLAI